MDQFSCFGTRFSTVAFGDSSVLTRIIRESEALNQTPTVPMVPRFRKATYPDGGQLARGVRPEGQVCHQVVERRRGGVPGWQGVAERPSPRGRGGAVVVGAAGPGDGQADLLQGAPVEAGAAAPRGVTQRDLGAAAERIHQSAAA